MSECSDEDGMISLASAASTNKVKFDRRPQRLFLEKGIGRFIQH
jgi:hypothetical protein